ncbi:MULTISPECIES: hypothetical protein [unclassified Bradyrhizobium]|uniref:hypothetical protein n=1 Tax=unclassified Bradyrhizobium TaxID=2631580 RepID=UPI002916F5DB|nr:MULTISPECIES: hypothetical protein [unclassified Bradyrhizobium]
MSGWKAEPRGPGNAEHKFVECEGERYELLAYTYDTGENYLASGFEIFARDRRGRYLEQVAIGKAPTLDEAKAWAEATARLPRSQWPMPRPL